MVHIIDNDKLHKDALLQTGFWGSSGAGCVFFAKATSKFLLPLRGPDVLEPNCWGMWGGATDHGESPEDSTRREVLEEAGYSEEYELIPIHVFERGTFSYHNFVAIVEHEFVPTVNWETAGWGWFALDQLPQPLHFGWSSLLADQVCMTKLQNLLK